MSDNKDDDHVSLWIYPLSSRFFCRCLFLLECKSDDGKMVLWLLLPTSCIILISSAQVHCWRPWDGFKRCHLPCLSRGLCGWQVADGRHHGGVAYPRGRSLATYMAAKKPKPKRKLNPLVRSKDLLLNIPFLQPTTLKDCKVLVKAVQAFGKERCAKHLIRLKTKKGTLAQVLCCITAASISHPHHPGYDGVADEACIRMDSSDCG